MARLSAFPVRPWWKQWHFWLLLVLAAQYAVLQALTSVQYGDSPRNLHWGLTTLEQPSFLLATPDPYERVDGFPPVPATLASGERPLGIGAPLHPWWGPVYPLLFAGVWALSGSYLLLQLVAPIGAGLVILVTYAFGSQLVSEPVAFVAALLLALFPMYREHAVLSYVEPLSALLLTCALWAFTARRTALAALCGSLTVLAKIDLILLYFGTVALVILLSRQEHASSAARRHDLWSLGLPALALTPWLLLTYVVNHRPTTVSGTPGLATLRFQAPLTFEQFFVSGWALTFLTFAVLGGCLALALFDRKPAARAAYRLPALWLALGSLVLLVYIATPGASNNPRVVIPALPACFLLVAAGLFRLAPRIRVLPLVFLLVIFVLVDGAGILFQIINARRDAALTPIWQELRDQPRGFVLTEDYWRAVLYSRQPVTWFEGDRPFQDAILQNVANFRAYLDNTPIRYIVLPAEPQAADRSLNALVAFYDRLPIGRKLDEPPSPDWTSPDVRAYLDTTFAHRTIRDYVLYTVDR